MTQRKILIVQDERMRLVLGDSFLDRRTFAVRSAMDAHHAIAIAQFEKPEAIVFYRHLEGFEPAAFCQAVMHRSGAHKPRFLLVLDNDAARSEHQRQVAQCAAYGLQTSDQLSLVQRLSALLAVNMRTSPRIAVHLLARAEVEKAGRATDMMAIIMTLSATGMRTELGQAVDVGDKLAMSFFLPQPHQLRVSVRCTVREQVEAASLHYSTYFDDNQDDVLASIAEFVRLRLASEHSDSSGRTTPKTAGEDPA